MNQLLSATVRSGTGSENNRHIKFTLLAGTYSFVDFSSKIKVAF